MKVRHLIACPCDMAPLTWTDDSAVRCEECGQTYPIRDGIVHLEPDAQVDPYGVIAQTVQNIRDADRPLLAGNSIRNFSHRFGLETIAQAHYDHLRPYLREATGLDDGCGLGFLLSRLSSDAQSVVGLDFVVENLERVNRDYGHRPNVLLVHGSGLRLPFASNSLDFVASSEVIEHVPDPTLYLQEIERVLKPGGVCTVSTPNAWMNLFPNPTNLKRSVFHSSLFMQLLRPERHWAEALPSHPAVLPVVLRRWCEKAGLRVLKHRGVLWSYCHPWKWSFERLMTALEWRGVPTHTVFVMAVRAGEQMFRIVGPLSRCFTVRQIVLVQKPPVESPIV